MSNFFTKRFLTENKIDLRVVVFDVDEEFKDNCLILSGLIQDHGYKHLFLEFLKENISYCIQDNLLEISNLKNISKGLVNVSVADVHASPSFISPVITQALLGTTVTILKQLGDWMLIQLADHYIGWVTETIVPITSELHKTWVVRKKLIVTCMHDFVYTSTKKEQSISDIVIGNILCASGNETFEMYEITFADGRKGFIDKQSVEIYYDWVEKRVATEDSVVETALKFTGIPYSWGGITCKALDCSGFVKLVYYLNGIMLQRDADQQALSGVDVPLTPDMENVKAGDLLFFGRFDENLGHAPISHVGISLGGKKFIHSSGNVHIGSFDSKSASYDARRSESLLKVKRIVGMDESKGVFKVSASV
jgi:cell wall-associated NlpC family hydrolase